MSGPHHLLDFKSKPASKRGRWPTIRLWMGHVLLNRQIAWAALALTLLATFLTWKSANEVLLQTQHAQFDHRISEVTTAIVKRLQGHEQV